MARAAYLFASEGNTLFPKDKKLGVLFECPGCGHAHCPRTAEANESPDGPIWGFNGDMEKPTFTPSILVRWDEGPDHIPKVCHSFVTDGMIQFLGDCTHKLAGQTVELPEI